MTNSRFADGLPVGSRDDPPAAESSSAASSTGRPDVDDRGSSGPGPGAATRVAVVILCDYFPPATRAGGPARSIFAIAATESCSYDLEVLTRDRDLGVRQAFPAGDVDAVRTALPAVRVHRQAPFGQSIRLARRLHRAAGRAELVYLNSLVSPVYTIWPLVLMRWRLVPRRRILLAPRGELSASALAIKSRKKRLVLPVLRRILARLDVTWHAATDREAADIRAFLPAGSPRVIVRANLAPPVAEGPPVTPDNDVLTVAFVGRMVSIKNFLLLARAAAHLEVPVRLLVVGPIEDADYWRMCQAVTDRLTGPVALDVRGGIDNSAVATLLAGSDVMVLPTRGESFGRAIAESLAVGCPVMIPDTTLWTPLLRAGAGWLIDPDDPVALADALTAYAGQTPAERGAIRSRVRAVYGAWWQDCQEYGRSLFAEVLAPGRPPLPRRAARGTR